MQIHTILLAVVSLLCIPLFAAYWLTYHKAVQSHFDLLCKQDNADLTADLSLWKKHERNRVSIAVSYIVLLVVWGSLQCYLGDTKSMLDWIFTSAFAPLYVGFILVNEHYNLEDLSNSMGLRLSEPQLRKRQ